MSRSYKHTPGFTDARPGSRRRKFYKRLANKRVRRMEIVKDHSFHKRATGELTYDICDYKFLAFTKSQLKELERIYDDHKHKIRTK